MSDKTYVLVCRYGINKTKVCVASDDEETIQKLRIKLDKVFLDGGDFTHVKTDGVYLEFWQWRHMDFDSKMGSVRLDTELKEILPPGIEIVDPKFEVLQIRKI